MIFIYDILLNLTDSFYYDFYEWDKKDNIVNIKKIPIIYIDTNTFKDFINCKIKVDKKFLNIIKDKSLIYKKSNDNYKYLTLLSNKERTIGICFLNNGTILYKSSMLFDEEEEANRLIEKQDITVINYKKLESNDNNLTLRKDYLKKKIMLREIKKIYLNKDYNKLRYIYYDIFNEELNDENKMYYNIVTYLNDSNNLDYVFDTIKH